MKKTLKLKRGTFTQMCKRSNYKDVQKFADDIMKYRKRGYLPNKTKITPKMIKRANFVVNARKFNHNQRGGNLVKIGYTVVDPEEQEQGKVNITVMRPDGGWLEDTKYYITYHQHDYVLPDINIEENPESMEYVFKIKDTQTEIKDTQAELLKKLTESQIAKNEAVGQKVSEALDISDINDRYYHLYLYIILEFLIENAVIQEIIRLEETKCIYLHNNTADEIFLNNILYLLKGQKINPDNYGDLLNTNSDIFSISSLKHLSIFELIENMKYIIHPELIDFPKYGLENLYDEDVVNNYLLKLFKLYILHYRYKKIESDKISIVKTLLLFQINLKQAYSELKFFPHFKVKDHKNIELSSFGLNVGIVNSLIFICLKYTSSDKAKIFGNIKQIFGRTPLFSNIFNIEDETQSDDETYRLYHTQINDENEIQNIRSKYIKLKEYGEYLEKLMSQYPSNGNEQLKKQDIIDEQERVNDDVKMPAAWLEIKSKIQNSKSKIENLFDKELLDLNDKDSIFYILFKYGSFPFQTPAKILYESLNVLQTDNNSVTDINKCKYYVKNERNEIDNQYYDIDYKYNFTLHDVYNSMFIRKSELTEEAGLKNFTEVLEEVKRNMGENNVHYFDEGILKSITINDIIVNTDRDSKSGNIEYLNGYSRGVAPSIKIIAQISNTILYEKYDIRTDYNLYIVYCPYSLSTDNESENKIDEKKIYIFFSNSSYNGISSISEKYSTDKKISVLFDDQVNEKNTGELDGFQKNLTEYIKSIYSLSLKQDFNNDNIVMNDADLKIDFEGNNTDINHFLKFNFSLGDSLENYQIEDLEDKTISYNNSNLTKYEIIINKGTNQGIIYNVIMNGKIGNIIISFNNGGNIEEQIRNKYVYIYIHNKLYIPVIKMKYPKILDTMNDQINKVKFGNNIDFFDKLNHNYLTWIIAMNQADTGKLGINEIPPGHSIYEYRSTNQSAWVADDKVFNTRKLFTKEYLEETHKIFKNINLLLNTKSIFEYFKKDILNADISLYNTIIILILLLDLKTYMLNDINFLNYKNEYEQEYTSEYRGFQANITNKLESEGTPDDQKTVKEILERLYKGNSIILDDTQDEYQKISEKWTHIKRYNSLFNIDEDVKDYIKNKEEDENLEPALTINEENYKIWINFLQVSMKQFVKRTVLGNSERDDGGTDAGQQNIMSMIFNIIKFLDEELDESDYRIMIERVIYQKSIDKINQSIYTKTNLPKLTRTDIILYGPAGTGKTALIQNIMKTYYYMNPVHFTFDITTLASTGYHGGEEKVMDVVINYIIEELEPELVRFNDFKNTQMRQLYDKLIEEKQRELQKTHDASISAKLKTDIQEYEQMRSDNNEVTNPPMFIFADELDRILQKQGSHSISGLIDRTRGGDNGATKNVIFLVGTNFMTEFEKQDHMALYSRIKGGIMEFIDIPRGYPNKWFAFYTIQIFEMQKNKGIPVFVTSKLLRDLYRLTMCIQYPDLQDPGNYSKTFFNQGWPWEVDHKDFSKPTPKDEIIFLDASTKLPKERAFMELEPRQTVGNVIEAGERLLKNYIKSRTTDPLSGVVTYSNPTKTIDEITTGETDSDEKERERMNEEFVSLLKDEFINEIRNKSTYIERGNKYYSYRKEK